MSSASPEPTPAAKRSPWLALHWQIFYGILVALAAAALARQVGVAEDGVVLQVTSFIGDLFLKLLKFIIVPLVVSTVIMGVSSIDVKNLGRLGAKTLAFYLGTTSLAVVVGLLAVNVVRPGDGVATATDYVPPLEPSPLREVFLDIVPENPFAAMSASFDLLSVIFFAIVMGIGIAIVGTPAKPLREVFGALEAVMMRITDAVMRLAPVGIAALLFDLVVITGLDVVGDLAAYMATVAGALLFHGAITLPLMVWVLARISPLQLIRALSPALLTAFSTASSASTLPLTMESTERRAGVDGEVASFVLPLGATVNMDGTALYEAVAAIFIAQAFGIDLTMGEQVIIFLTATLAAIGAAGVPSAGLVTMIIVLEAVGLPVAGIGLLVAVDRILDMMRTTVNVWGDACGAAVIAASEGKLDRAVLADPRAGM
jgi:Na+/H+-dicarboxylate symporter